MKRAEKSSFRDPSGHIFHLNGNIYRQINSSYQSAYDQLMSSGLYHELVERNWLITHEETNIPITEGVYKLIKPKRIDHINYPYEWCFSQLKEAALLTLGIQKAAIEKGMILKDATGFNICFVAQHPVFIDTLSFEKYDQTKPWVAYRQFCECFLAPLLLAQHAGAGMIRMLSLYPDGIPLSVCSQLLPWTSTLKPLPALHVHLQGAIGSNGSGKNNTGSFTKEKMLRIINHLEKGISKMDAGEKKTNWSHYYEETILQGDYLAQKKKGVIELTSNIEFDSVIDLGANAGAFSILFAEQGKRTLATDSDHLAIEHLFQESKKLDLPITALVTDLMNPSPDLGWNNEERASFSARQKADLVLALALVHHLCIGKNLPFDMLFEGLSAYGKYLLIEFVPKDDEKVKLLLNHRKDIFDHYHEAGFIAAAEAYYSFLGVMEIGNMGRKLFLMKNKLIP